jgi:hypothetical protein
MIYEEKMFHDKTCFMQKKTCFMRQAAFSWKNLIDLTQGKSHKNDRKDRIFL